MEMRRIKHILLSILIFIILVSCEHGIKKTDLKIPYQTFIVDSNTAIHTFMMDMWREEGYIMCKNSDTTYISRLDTDPVIPIIKSVSNDTIYLAYYCDKMYGYIDTTIICKSVWKWAQKVGEYEIVQQRYYFLKGSGGITADTIDRIYRGRDSIVAYRDSQRIMSAPINDVFAERRYNGCFLSVFTIDTTRMLQNWTSYYVDNSEILKKLVP